MSDTNIGVVGCGNISGIYFQNLAQFQGARVVACADIESSKASQAADRHGVRCAESVEALMADPEIQVVLNLTVPKAHAAVSLAALRAGKHVYGEKPLATNRDDGRTIIEEAASRSLRVGSAPDTFLGGGHQTCRKLVDDGVIGEPVGATAFMLCHGHESWHPSPEFYYEIGGGPMMDMGPYYLTALVNLLGPVARLTGSARVTFPERLITSEPKRGKVVQVETPTHIAGIMDFASGAVGTILTTFDVWHSTLPRIEVYGTEGSLLIPDPNGFGGVPMVRCKGDGEWRPVEITHGFNGNARGIGVTDMVAAQLAGRPHRASGELAYHVLDVMLGFNDASASGEHYVPESTCERPAALP
ncbi:MAG: Gfo/Idh/MocA family oxidoreductase, partial [Armatimonadetes bacterium]|nr:Gfo/Idh/MocA family oxidoreductase [Armatimonadota bacterium]